jgi:hypothetical protein
MRTFSATLLGSSHGVIWSVPGAPANGAVDSTGTYSAPAATGTYTLVATAVDDASVTASATIDVTSTIAVAVSPAGTVVAAGTPQAFSAMVTGTANQAVSWSLVGAPVGYSIDGSGVLSSPNGGSATFTVQAVSVVGSVVGQTQVTVVSSSLHTVSGTITWAGPVPHRIFVSAFDPLDGNNYPLAGTSIAGPGPYVIRGVRQTNSAKLQVRAWADHGNLRRSGGADPQAVSDPLPFDGSANLTGVDLALAAPTPPLASGLHPSINMVVVAAGGIGVGFDHLLDNNNDDVADHYNIYLSTQANPGPQNQIFVRTVDSAIEGTAFFSLPNGTTVYAGVTAVNSTGESPVTAAGPYVIGPTTPPGSTISGDIDLGSLPTLGQLNVFARCAGNAIVGTIVQNLIALTPFSITRVPDGTCRFYARLDHDQDGVPGPLDPEVVPAQMATIAGDTTLPTFSLPNGNARFAVNVVRTFDTSGVLQSEHMAFVVRPVTKLPAKATLLSGPGFATMFPIDVPVGEHYGGNVELALRDLIPSGATISVGDKYQMLVTYDDGSSETLSGSVTGVLQPPTNLMVSAGTTPTFSWTDPVLPAFVDYRLEVVVSNNPSWFAEGVSSPTVYNFDGAGQPLATGVAASWTLQLRDGYDNEVDVSKNFTP